MYVPYLQQAWRSMSFVVRTAGDPSSHIATVRREVAGIATDVAPYSFKTFANQWRAPLCLGQLLLEVQVACRSCGQFGRFLAEPLLDLLQRSLLRDGRRVR